VLCQQNGSTSRYWYILDGRGNVVAPTDASGSVVDRYGYGPWGKPISNSESVAQPFRHANFEWRLKTSGQWQGNAHVDILP
jgi:hypothetical protein